jgi:hypothetical protein
MTATLTLTPPSEAAFGTEDFLPASDLERMAARFIAEYPGHFGHVANARLSILWKRAGGKSRGQIRMGQCSKTSGRARFWGESEFVIWLAADHLRRSPSEKIANVLFHELLHIGSDPDTGDAKIVGHDLEFFFAEVSERGLWRPEMEQAHEVFTQLRLIPYEAAD